MKIESDIEVSVNAFKRPMVLVVKENGGTIGEIPFDSDNQYAAECLAKAMEAVNKGGLLDAVQAAYDAAWNANDDSVSEMQEAISTVVDELEDYVED